MSKEDLEYYDECQGSRTHPETTSKLLTKLFRARNIVSILDCGCGTGAYAIPLTKEGINVTAIDINNSVMNRAQEKANRQGIGIKFKNANMINYKPNKRVGAIISMYNTISVLTRDQFKKTLRNWHEILPPKGLLIFDVYNFDYMKRKYITTRYLTDAKQIGSKFYVVFHDDRLDEKEKIMRVKMEIFKQTKWTDLKKEIYQENLQIYSVNELEKILKEIGFKILEKHGGYSKKGFLPFKNEKSEFIVITAEKINQ